MRSKEIMTKLKKDGWREVRRKASSHRQFRHPTKPGTVTVPHPEADMAIGTIKSIEKQSGVKLR
jgi:predicted RNA binding protein YcfA (HicA-like mRNA interferase family)